MVRIRVSPTEYRAFRIAWCHGLGGPQFAVWPEADDIAIETSASKLADRRSPYLESSFSLQPHSSLFLSQPNGHFGQTLGLRFGPVPYATSHLGFPSIPGAQRSNAGTTHEDYSYMA